MRVLLRSIMEHNEQCCCGCAGSQVVHQGMRSYYFSADTQEDMLGWVRALGQAAAMEQEGTLNRCGTSNHLARLDPSPNRTHSRCVYTKHTHSRHMKQITKDTHQTYSKYTKQSHTPSI